jgi:hypothetical protein
VRFEVDGERDVKCDGVGDGCRKLVELPSCAMSNNEGATCNVDVSDELGDVGGDGSGS